MILLAALMLAGTPAWAEAPHPPAEQPDRDAGHRFGVDFAPYSVWSWYFGDVQGRSDSKLDASRSAFGVGLHWEYAPIRYFGAGVRVDVQLPGRDEQFLLVLPSITLRGVLPIGRWEIFLLAQGGAAYLQYGDFVGYGYNLGADLGVGYRVSRRWGVQLHGGYQFVATYSGDDTIRQPFALRGLLGFYYLL